MEVTITLDLDKLFDELHKNGWKPSKTSKYYKNYILKHIGEKDTILAPGESERYLVDLLTTISSRHFLSIVKPGPGKNLLVEKIVYEYTYGKDND